MAKRKRKPVAKKPDEVVFWKPSPKKPGEELRRAVEKMKKNRGPFSGVTKNKKALAESPVFWERKMQLPTESIWPGNDKRMPPGYSRDRKWNCPSCDVPPGHKHEQFCPRYIFQLNPYNASAYDDNAFLADYIDKQIWFGEGHPQYPNAPVPVPIGQRLLERARVRKQDKPKPAPMPELFEDWPTALNDEPDDLPF